MHAILIKKYFFFLTEHAHLETTEATWSRHKWIRNWRQKGGRGLILYTVLWCSLVLCTTETLRLKQTACIPTPTDSDAAVWERRAKAEGGLSNRMQLNAVYKWLSVSVWACYSCKGHHYWEGHAKLAGRKRRAVRGDDGRWACAVLRSLLQLTVGNRKLLLPSWVTTTFSLNMWVVVQRVLPSQLLRSVVMMFWGWFTSCLKEGNYLGRRFKKKEKRSVSQRYISA